MGIYKTELHCHTKESSACAKIEARKIIEWYAKEGYHTIVITDHCSKRKMDKLGNLSWKEKIDYVLTGYRQAKQVAQAYGITVLLGCEITHQETDSDFLALGIEESFLYDHEEIYNASLADLHRWCEQAGCLLVQAHPFRDEIQLAPLEDIDGIEVFNGCYNEVSRNEKAMAYGNRTNKILSSGSDFHAKEDLARGGIITKEPIQTNKQLVQVLESKAFQRIVEGKYGEI